MTRNLKALGLVVFALTALGALTAQGASAAKEQEFRSSRSWTIGEGTAALSMAVGSAGTIACGTTKLEDQSGGNKVGEEYLSDTLTVTPSFSECTFAGSPVTVKVNHCAFVIDSDLTEDPEGGEDANGEVECAGTEKLEFETSICTVTVGAQLVKHVIDYPEDTAFSMSGTVSGKNIVTGKVKTKESQTGCLLFPTGAIGTLSGNGTTKCFKDEGSVLKETEKTTPAGNTSYGETIECSVK